MESDRRHSPLIATKGSASAKAHSDGTQPKTTVTINASVKNGDLYGMSFHDATGVITPTRNRPLDFLNEF